MYKFSCRSNTLGARGEGKHKFCTHVNSKFEKIEEKNKKKWNFVGLKILRCARCVHIFVVFGHRRSSWRKKQILAQKTLKKCSILFFFSRAPRTSFGHQNLQAPCALKPLWRQINSIFFEIFCYFLNLLFIGMNYFCFPLPRAPRVSNQHEIVHAPCGHDYLRSHQISYFFDFFAIFSGRSKTFDRTVTTKKGISLSETNGEGAKLSISKN